LWGFVSWILFVWFVLIIRQGENNEHIRWESVPTRPF
jgi:hypothetical protein